MAYENVTPPELPDFSSVTGYSYNGVELPDINEVWTDKETYPHAGIVLRDSNSKYYLVIRNSTLGGIKVNADSKYSNYSTPVWVFDGTQWTSGSSPAMIVGPVIWSNTDVYYADSVADVGGTLYLAASEPVPIQPYPYYVLLFNYTKDKTDWYDIHLYYSDTAFTYDGSAVTNTGNTFVQVASPSSDTWSDAYTVTPTLSPGLNDTVYQRIYTNHDILDSEGNVYLAADSVTAVEETESSTFDLKSFLVGFGLGLAGKPLPLEVKREIVGYSYNGVVLPELPEWDRESYPYAAITSNVSMSLTLCKGNLTAKKLDNGTIAISYIGEQAGDVLGYEIVDGAWELTWTAFSYTYFYEEDLVWANTDLYYNEENGGALYLATSEPIPVYE